MKPYISKQNLSLAAVIIALLGSAKLHAQSTVNTTGGSQAVGSNIYEYSVGEMALVHTASSPTITITHGILQPVQGKLSVEEIDYLNGGLVAYPNPASDVVYLQPSLPGGGMLKYVFTDVRGRRLLTQNAALHTGTERQSIDITPFADGNYLLLATFTLNGKDYTRSFKIIKHSKIK